MLITTLPAVKIHRVWIDGLISARMSNDYHLPGVMSWNMTLLWLAIKKNDLEFNFLVLLAYFRVCWNFLLTDTAKCTEKKSEMNWSEFFVLLTTAHVTIVIYFARWFLVLREYEPTPKPLLASSSHKLSARDFFPCGGIAAALVSVWRS